MTTRRHFHRLALAACTAPLWSRAARAQDPASRADWTAALETGLAGVEAASGGRLGVAVLDTATGAGAGHRAGERFPLCSTFKLLAAAAVLDACSSTRKTCSAASSSSPATWWTIHPSPASAPAARA